MFNRLYKILVQWGVQGTQRQEWSGSLSIQAGRLLKLSAYGKTVLKPPYGWTSEAKDKSSGILIDLEADQRTAIMLRFKDFKTSFRMGELFEKKSLLKQREDIRIDLIGEGQGKAAIEPKEFHAGIKELFRVRYKVGEEGMAVGGGIKLVKLIGQGGDWQYEKPEVQMSNESASYNLSEVVERIVYDDIPQSALSIIQVTLRESPLKPGDEIILNFPDSRTQTLATKEHKFVVLEDTRGNGLFRRIPDCPIVEVVAQKPAGFLIQSASIIGTGTSFTVTIKTVDKYNNIASDFTGKVSLYLVPENGNEKLLGSFVVKKQDRGVKQFKGISLTEPGYYYFRAKGETGKTLVMSSFGPPVKIENGGKINQSYWGDLHVHTHLSDGYYSPDFVYEYGKEVAGLDFCAVTDHDHWVTDTAWAKTQKAAKRYNQQGKFVTFLASEVGIGPTTDFIIYYADDEAPIIHSAGVFFYAEDKSYYPDDCVMSIKKLLRPIKKKDFIFIPHHLYFYATGRYAQGMDEWFGQRLEPVAEVYSMWGNSEYSNCLRHPLKEECINRWFNLVYGLARKIIIGSNKNALKFEKAEKGKFLYQDILKRGYRMGVIGSGDNHQSTPGSLNPGYLNRAGRNKFCGPHANGVVAVRAKSLTRRGILEALRQRRCYASTGARIIIDFSINGHQMGEDVELKGEQYTKLRLINVSVAGTDIIERITLVRNNKELYNFSGDSKIEKFQYVDSEPIKDIVMTAKDVGGLGKRFIFYYLRVAQEDGHMACSSPIWFSFE